MVKYKGPKLKIIRRLGILPGLTSKYSKLRKRTPGQHGKRLSFKSNRSSLSSDFKDRLLEKQKIRYNYGLTEKQLFNCYNHIKKIRHSTTLSLLTQLELRLDCIVYRLGFAPTIRAARQLISHKHIKVNSRVVNIPSFFCTKGDIIESANKKSSSILIKKNYDLYSEKRALILQKIKDIRFSSVKKILASKVLLPSYLNLEQKVSSEFENTTFKGIVSANVTKKDISINANELKVMEYYSR